MMRKLAVILGLLTVLSACNTTTGSTGGRPGYEAGGMCNGGAHCGGYR